MLHGTSVHDLVKIRLRTSNVLFYGSRCIMHYCRRRGK